MLGALGAAGRRRAGRRARQRRSSGFFASLFYGVDAGFHVDAGVLVASLVVGLIGPPLAAMPAIRRASRLPVARRCRRPARRSAARGGSTRCLRRVTFLPRSAQIGLRGVARRKRRTLATALQVALAVGALLALLALGTSVGNTTREYYDDMRFDVLASTVATRAVRRRGHARAGATPGVAAHQPLLTRAPRPAARTSCSGALPTGR